MVYTITINNTQPIFFYSPVAGHCQAGMVGVINPYVSQNRTGSLRKVYSHSRLPILCPQDCRKVKVTVDLGIPPSLDQVLLKSRELATCYQTIRTTSHSAELTY